MNRIDYISGIPRRLWTVDEWLDGKSFSGPNPTSIYYHVTASVWIEGELWVRSDSEGLNDQWWKPKFDTWRNLHSIVQSDTGNLIFGQRLEGEA